MASTELHRAFEQAALNNLWGDLDSKSGPGSNLIQTRLIRKAIPELLKKYSIKTLLDAPCGDFYWMKDIIDKITATSFYTGADIVEQLVEVNKKNYGSEKVKFIHLNLIKDPTPSVDLIFTRDCFIHLSFANICKILKNYKRSGSAYLLLSTYTKQERVNVDVDHFFIDGRALNMRNFPFFFPEPLLVINEGCTEGNGNYTDKSLALWKLKEINLSKILVNLKILFAVNLLRKVKNKIFRS
jgi:hypothetical protein